MHVIGIDLGGTKVTGALFSLDGKILLHKHLYLDGKKGVEVGDLIIQMIKQFLSLGVKIIGVGVCIPGIVNKKTGLVWAPNIPEWEQYPLLAEIEAILPADKSINVEIESDRTCYILGEKWKGGVKDEENAVYFSVGTGVGLGILIDGRVVHGHADIVGAIGWMALQSPYTEMYKNCGCFETFASGNGIANHAKYLLDHAQDQFKNSLLNKVQRDKINCSDVFHTYSLGDKLAQDVINKAIQLWGMAAANVVSLLNPAVVVWGGGVFGPATIFIDKIYEESTKWAQPIAIKQVKYIPSSVSNGAGLIGAGYLALTSSKQEI